MPGRSPSPTLAGLLSSRRQERFGGRSAEIELFNACLASNATLLSVLWIYGPGGIGKSALLDRLTLGARRSAVPVGKIDARNVVATPDGIRAAVEAAVPVSPDSTDVAGSDATVLLLDSYERFGDSDDWIREQLLPGLPAQVLIVLAGRSPPAPGWCADPAWRELHRVVALRNLTPEESGDYLRRTNLAAFSAALMSSAPASAIGPRPRPTTGWPIQAPPQPGHTCNGSAESMPANGSPKPASSSIARSTSRLR